MKLPGFRLLPALLISTACFGQGDIKPTYIFPVDYLPVGTHTFDVMLQNAGNTNIGMSSIAYKIGWQVDNGAAMEATPTAPTYGLFPGQAVRVEGSFNATFSTVGSHHLKVWTRAVNFNDINHANDTIVQVVKVLPYVPVKNVVMEVFKHQACCPCFDAANYEDTAVTVDPHYSVANIYCGPIDVLYNAEGDTINDEFQLPHPNVFFDRYTFPYAYTQQRGFYTLDDVYDLTDMHERERYYQPVEVSFSSAGFDNASRLLKVKLKAKAYDTLSGDLRFNLYVTEDSIKAYQACAVPDPNNYYHMNVLRRMCGETWGKSGSLPATLMPGQEVFYEFNYTVPQSYVLNHLHLIGLVQQYSSDTSKRWILNSAKISFGNALTLDVQEMTNSSDRGVHIFPNPVTGKAYMDIPQFSGNAIDASLTDITGKQLKRIIISGPHTEIEMHDLSSGIYFINLVLDGRQRTFKIIKK